MSNNQGVVLGDVILILNIATNSNKTETEKLDLILKMLREIVREA